LVAVLSIYRLNAQNSTQIKSDSLRQKLVADSAKIWKKTIAKGFLKFEDRFSFLDRKQVSLLGFMVGATFYNHHTFFVGYFLMDPRQTSPIQFEGFKPNSQLYLNLNYFALGYQYVLYNKKHFQINIPVSAGFGNYKLETVDKSDNSLTFVSGKILPLNAGLQFIYKPIFWAGVSVSGGYNYFGHQENTVINLQGWYYSFGVWVDGRHVFRYLRYQLKKKKYHNNMASLQQLTN